MPLKTVRVRPSAQRRLESGHKWIFSNEVVDQLSGYEPGELVMLRGDHNRKLGVGYINPHALISVRLLADEVIEPDEAFFRGRFEAALAWRHRAYPGLETFRLVHADSDGLPGLIVDKYADHLSVQVLTSGMEALKPLWLPPLVDLIQPAAVVARNDTDYREYEGLPQEVEVLHGTPAEAVEVDELGVKYAVDVRSGQKTGLFLDQKDNRARLDGLVKGGRVLDAFCYVGGWSIRAAVAGATEAVGIDASEAALTTARGNAELNGVADRVHFERGDVFDTFRLMVAEGETFDTVIVDPPAFAKRQAQVKAAIGGYRDVNIQALKLVKPGGLLVSCSCSHHINPERFRTILAQAGRAAKRTLRLVEQRGAAVDHPVLIGMRETEYLKCLIFHVSE